MSEAILELRDEEPDRPFMRFAGEVIHFKLQSDLSLKEYKRVQSLGKAFEGLSDDDVDEKKMDDMVSALVDAARLCLYDAPDGLVETMTDGERLKIVEAFVIALRPQANPEAPSETTPQNSPGSTTSTLSE